MLISKSSKRQKFLNRRTADWAIINKIPNQGYLTEPRHPMVLELYLDMQANKLKRLRYQNIQLRRENRILRKNSLSTNYKVAKQNNVLNIKLYFALRRIEILEQQLQLNELLLQSYKVVDITPQAELLGE